MDLRQVINNLKQLADYCDGVASGNVSHKIAHLKYGIINISESLELNAKALELGWHPANELPVIPKGEDKVEVYCLVHGKGLTILVPMKLHYTVSRGFGVSENIEIKWWCYPPKED